MNRVWKIIFTALIIVFTVHFIRDILQIFNIDNLLATPSGPRRWCKPYCDYVTVPPELFIIISSIIVLKRNRVGKLGFVVLTSLIYWPFAAFLP